MKKHNDPAYRALTEILGGGGYDIYHNHDMMNVFDGGNRGYEKGNPECERSVQDVYALQAAAEDRKDA